MNQLPCGMLMFQVVVLPCKAQCLAWDGQKGRKKVRHVANLSDGSMK